MPAIILEKRGHQAWITLNRPEQKNTLNGEAFLGLLDAWQEVRDDAAIRVAVVTAAGDTDFCCGGDLSEVMPSNLNDWASHLLKRSSVADSVVDDFESQFLEFFRKKGSYILG